jgi:transcriptional regulator with XRE-family HTH domain
VRPDERPLEERVAWTVAEARVAIDERRGYVEDKASGCWLAQRRTMAGFGSYLTVYEAVFGLVPSGWTVYHSCGNGSVGCIRPSHLEITEEGAHVHMRNLLPAVIAHDFAERIRAERAARQATMQQFARELGVAQSTLEGWEAGTSSPTVDDYKRLTRRMGWEAEPQKWAVTVVVQQFVVAASAGDAARAVLEDIEREDGDRHVAVYNVIAGKDLPRIKGQSQKAARRPTGIPTMAKLLAEKKTRPRRAPPGKA